MSGEDCLKALCEASSEASGSGEDHLKGFREAFAKYVAILSMPEPLCKYGHVVLVSPVSSITKPRFPSLECLDCRAYSLYDYKLNHKKDCPSGETTQNLLDFVSALITDSVLIEFVRRYNEYNASN